MRDLLVVMLLAAGCGGASELEPEPGVRDELAAPTCEPAPPVFEGTDSPAAEDAVVSIARRTADGTWKFAGTGTLIGPRTVLTARHVTCRHRSLPGLAYECVTAYAADDLGVFVGRDSTVFGTDPTVVAERVLTLPGQGAQFAFGTTALEDVALLRLPADSPLSPVVDDEGHARYPKTTTCLPSESGSVHLVGWGQTTDGVLPTIRQQKDIKVRSIAFDAHSEEAHQPAELTVYAGPCPGDSGAPEMAGGGIAAVVSTGILGCGKAGSRATLLAGRVGAWVRGYEGK